MSLYLGYSEKLTINYNGSACIINSPNILSTGNNTRLLSADSYILKDFNNTYLVQNEYSQEDGE